MARRNLEFEMPRRLVKISDIKLIALGKNSVVLEISCGKGTYIRSLAIDIGERLKIPATLKNLIRLRVGDFDLKNSATLDELNAENILPVENCLNHLPRFELKENRVHAFLNGLPTTLNAPDEKALRIFSGGKFLGIGKIESGELRSAKII